MIFQNLPQQFTRLKELENTYYVKKQNKTYYLTSNSQLLAINMLKLIENGYIINKNEYFWNNHDLKDIHKESIRNLYLLKEAECVNSINTDLTKTLTTYMNVVSKATCLKIILPIFRNTFKYKHRYLRKRKFRKNLEILTSETILKSINKTPLFKNRLKKDKIDIKILKKEVNIFLICTNE